MIQTSIVKARFYVLGPREIKQVRLNDIVPEDFLIQITPDEVMENVGLYISRPGDDTFINFANTSNKKIRLTLKARTVRVMCTDQYSISYK